jgi:hypothetical protein
MANKFDVLDANQAWSDTPSRRVKRSVAELLLRRLLAERDPDFPYRIRMLIRGENAPMVVAEVIAEVSRFWDGPLGVGNLMPFARVQNPLMHPARLHYPIPAAGAHDRRTSVAANNYLPPEWLHPIVG